MKHVEDLWRHGSRRKPVVSREVNGRAVRMQTLGENRRFAVYVISPADKGTPCKIGVSCMPGSRLGDLQVSHWSKLEISRLVWVSNRWRAFKIEAETHRTLKKHELSGEWFDITRESAEKAILDVVAKFKMEAIDSADEMNLNVSSSG